MRFSVIVHPGAKRVSVGGDYAGSLIVRVSAPAIDNKANDAALAALATVFSVRRSSLHLVMGQKSRRKVFELLGANDAHLAILETLLATPAR